MHDLSVMTDELLRDNQYESRTSRTNDLCILLNHSRQNMQPHIQPHIQPTYLYNA